MHFGAPPFHSNQASWLAWWLGRTRHFWADVAIVKGDLLNWPCDEQNSLSLEQSLSGQSRSIE
jgi:hypothetical protein